MCIYASPNHCATIRHIPIHCKSRTQVPADARYALPALCATVPVDALIGGPLARPMSSHVKCQHPTHTSQHTRPSFSLASHSPTATSRAEIGALHARHASQSSQHGVHTPTLTTLIGHTLAAPRSWPTRTAPCASMVMRVHVAQQLCTGVAAHPHCDGRPVLHHQARNNVVPSRATALAVIVAPKPVSRLWLSFLFFFSRKF